MASIVVAGDTSGTVTLAAPSVAGTTTLTLPTVNGTVLTNASSIASSQLPTGSVLQVVQTVLTTSVTGSADTWTTVASASITPSSASNKVLVMYSTNTNSVDQETLTRILRGASILAQYSGGDVSYVGMTMGSLTTATNWGGQNFSMTYLDSPSSTSSLTYNLQGYQNGNTLRINRSTGTTAGDSQGGITTITLMEIVG